MADVFISYSRRDQDFVRALHQALGDHGRETWVDWEDIPPTAEWLTEVYAAIDAADTFAFAFAFVISPDSIASEICQLEVTHAVQHHKRPVPKVIELSEGQGKGPPIGEWRAKQRELEDQTLLGEVKAHPMVKQAVALFGVEVIQASRIAGEKEAP